MYELKLSGIQKWYKVMRNYNSKTIYISLTLAKRLTVSDLKT